MPRLTLERKAALPALLCALVILPALIAPVSGWTNLYTSGDWVECQRHHFIKDGDNTGEAAWNETVAGFNGYWLMLHNVTWENYREWWWFDSMNAFYIRLQITTGDGTAYVITRLGGRTDIFGLMNTFHVSVGASSNATSWDMVPLTIPSFSTYGFDVAGWNPEEFQLFVIPESGQTKIVWIWAVGDKNIAYTTVLDFAIGGCCNASITLTYAHEGYGHVEGYVSDSFTLPTLPPYEDIKSGWLAWLSNALGIDLGSAIATLLMMVRLFFEVVKLTLPILGAIVFLWMMDTIFTSVITGEVRLIGDMFLKIYDVIIAIWRTLVTIIQTIKDLITFWS